MTQIINQPDMNLLDIPDMSVDFNSVTSCSCGLENADELLNYFYLIWKIGIISVIPHMNLRKSMQIKASHFGRLMM